MAYGLFGWSEEQFWNCECEYFFKAYNGRLIFEEQKSRQEWERLRILGAWVVGGYSRQRLTAKDLLPLPWDRPKTREEFIRENKEILEATARLKKLYG